jgi:hypothetical protein
MVESKNSPVKLAAWLASGTLLLAGVLGWKGILPPNGILALAALAIRSVMAIQWLK